MNFHTMSFKHYFNWISTIKLAYRIVLFVIYYIFAFLSEHLALTDYETYPIRTGTIDSLYPNRYMRVISFTISLWTNFAPFNATWTLNHENLFTSENNSVADLYESSGAWEISYVSWLPCFWCENGIGVGLILRLKMLVQKRGRRQKWRGKGQK